MKIKYFSLKLMRLLCTSIYFLTFLASFGRTEFLLSLLLGIFTLGHLIGVFSVLERIRFYHEGCLGV